MGINHELDHSIGFLMGITYRKLSSILQQRLKEYDITPEQWSVLYHIDRAGGMIQKEIAKRARKDRPTITRIIDLLESKGFVYKQIGDSDRRSFVVYTTEKGKLTIQATIPIEQRVTDDIKQCMTEVEFFMLIELVNRINNHIDNVID